jgi:hypothetical protein
MGAEAIGVTPRKAVPAGLIVIAFVALAHFAAALTLGERPFATYFTLAWVSEALATLLIPFVLWMLGTTASAMWQKHPRPLLYLAQSLGDQRSRFLTAAALLVCYALVNRAYRAIKVAIQRISPFDSDPMLLEWDRVLFGTDPWILTHSVIGDTGTLFIDRVYSTWFIVILLAFAFAAFSADRAFQLRASLTHFLIWILLGNVLAMVWSSAGPVYYQHFYGDPLFAPLAERLAGMDITATRLQAYLLEVVGDEAIGSGISAMPSVHCAMTMYLVVAAHDRWGVSWQLAAAVVYHLLILLGSVHLGWHYAVDGLLSSVAVPILWWAAKFAVPYPRKPAPER